MRTPGTEEAAVIEGGERPKYRIGDSIRFMLAGRELTGQITATHPGDYDQETPPKYMVKTDTAGWRTVYQDNIVGLAESQMQEAANPRALTAIDAALQALEQNARVPMGQIDRDADDEAMEQFEALSKLLKGDTANTALADAAWTAFEHSEYKKAIGYLTQLRGILTAARESTMRERTSHPSPGMKMPTTPQDWGLYADEVNYDPNAEDTYKKAEPAAAALTAALKKAVVKVKGGMDPEEAWQVDCDAVARKYAKVGAYDTEPREVGILYLDTVRDGSQGEGRKTEVNWGDPLEAAEERVRTLQGQVKTAEHVLKTGKDMLGHPFDSDYMSMMKGKLARYREDLKKAEVALKQLKGKTEDLIEQVVQGASPDQLLEQEINALSGEQPDATVPPEPKDPSFAYLVSWETGGSYPHNHTVELDAFGHGCTSEDHDSQHEVQNFQVLPDPKDGHTHRLDQGVRRDVPSSTNDAGQPESFHHLSLDPDRPLY